MLSAIRVTTLMPIKKAISAIESYSSQYRLRARMPLDLGNEVHESPSHLMVGDRFAAIASSSSINMFKIGCGKRIHACGENFCHRIPITRPYYFGQCLGPSATTIPRGCRSALRRESFQNLDQWEMGDGPHPFCAAIRTPPAKLRKPRTQEYEHSETCGSSRSTARSFIALHVTVKKDLGW